MDIFESILISQALPELLSSLAGMSLAEQVRAAHRASTALTAAGLVLDGITRVIQVQIDEQRGESDGDDAPEAPQDEPPTNGHALGLDGLRVRGLNGAAN